MHRFFRPILYATVFSTGAAVLIVEVVAVRILSPHFGSSLFVLSSVLTTILAALSLGYYVGGRLSDRFPTHEPLYRIITASGISIMLLQYVAIQILPTAGAVLSVMSGPLLISMLLFFVPGFLLGIVSPYVIKLQSLHTPEDRVGSVVGATFFWGTVGSILGSLLSGFYLVPFIGAKQSLVYTGALLVLVGICGELGFELLRKGRGRALYVIKRRALYLIGSLLIVMILWKLIAMTSTRLMLDVVHESEGIYSHILVYEANHLGKRIRAMKRDTNSSSATYLDTHELVYGYTQFAGLYTLLKPDAARFLLIGGGAYSIPRTLVAYDPKIIVDVVEIEPVLFELSREYFDLSDVSRINNHVMDGRVFLQKSDATYDVIFGDAFGTDLGVPHHLASKEFFEEAKRHLTPEGLFLLNFVGTLYQEPLTLTGSLMKTIESVFPNMKVYAFNKRRPDTLQNIMVIARNGSEPIDLEGTRINGTNGGILSIPSLEVSFEDFDLEHEIILTDDRAPLEYLMVRQY